MKGLYIYIHIHNFLVYTLMLRELWHFQIKIFCRLLKEDLEPKSTLNFHLKEFYCAPARLTSKVGVLVIW